ncbi:helicase [Tanacetum coccineum]
MVSEVAALITNDFGYGIPSRDIVVDNKDEGPKRISELHPSYMALQYPLLFPYREDGDPAHLPTIQPQRCQKVGGSESTNDFGDGIPSRDIMVDNKDEGPKRISELHPSYMALQYPLLFPYGEDRGDTNAEGLGKRIVLPRNFTGGPRYMMQNYQDAMALCRAYGNPDLFITFTSNPKWPEIDEMLSFIPGQKPYNRPEVSTRIFKLKLTHLLDDLTKNEIFGKTCSFVYVIEFQKRGLPHAHILLWLEEEWKCKTPNQVDDMISAELPPPTTDPEGYKVVTEFILRGPCGKGAACTVEGKCSKTFPKPFYSETNLEEDGYPVYRRRDSKVQAVKAVWWLFSFDIHYSQPSDMKLNFHFEDQQAITLHDSQNLPALLNREEIKITMFTKWFELNKHDTKARELTYAEIPKGPRGFKELMKVNKKLYLTFKAACFTYGLLNDDKEWAHAIKEAAF